MPPGIAFERHGRVRLVLAVAVRRQPRKSSGRSWRPSSAPRWAIPCTSRLLPSHCPILGSVMGVHADWPLRFTRRSLQVLLCALAAHAAAYRSLVPSDSMHGYMGLYETVVGALSAVAVGLLMLALVAVLAGRKRPIRALVGRPAEGLPFTNRVTWLAGAALGVLVVQESLERSFEARTIAVGGAPVGTWLMALAVIVVVATTFVLLERSCGGLICALLNGRATLPRAPARMPTPRSASRGERRRNSLADFRGRRAPPLLVA